jgi:hypothetical protein
MSDGQMPGFNRKGAGKSSGSGKSWAKECPKIADASLATLTPQYLDGLTALMDRTTAMTIITSFLEIKSRDSGMPLCLAPESVTEHLFGWSFGYQSRAFLETDDFLNVLVGHGPIVVLNDGRILEGGSLHRDAAAVLRSHGINP